MGRRQPAGRSNGASNPDQGALSRLSRQAHPVPAVWATVRLRPPPRPSKPLPTEVDEMNVLDRIVAFFVRAVDRRRNRWVEISLDRAWSRDLPPRLFDI